MAVPPGERNRYPTIKDGLSCVTAWSPRRSDPLASELVERLLANDEVAYLRAPKWGPAVWSRERVQLLTQYLNDLVGAGRLGDLDDPNALGEQPSIRARDVFEA
jgi:hypothetical protein